MIATGAIEHKVIIQATTALLIPDDISQKFIGLLSPVVINWAKYNQERIVITIKNVIFFVFMLLFLIV